MKYINKGEEPESLRKWKALANENWQPTYASLSRQEKADIYNSLLKEQGFICCYCGRRISTDGDKPEEKYHIEHLKPQKKYPDLALEYTNMLASCQGESDSPPKPVHCRNKKGAWYDENLMVSPLDIECGDYFKYTGSGEIEATEDSDKQAAAETTICKLGLNVDKLKAMRRNAIRSTLRGIDDLTDEEIEQLARGYEKLDKEGKYTPFVAAVVYTLKHYYIS